MPRTLDDIEPFCIGDLEGMAPAILAIEAARKRDLHNLAESVAAEMDARLMALAKT
jgi:hypothetical protein